MSAYFSVHCPVPIGIKIKNKKSTNPNLTHIFFSDAIYLHSIVLRKIKNGFFYELTRPPIKRFLNTYQIDGL